MASHRFSVPYDLEEQVDSYLLHAELLKKAAGPWKIFLAISLILMALFALIEATKASIEPEDAVWALPASLAIGALAAWLPQRVNRPSVKQAIQKQWDELKRQGQETIYRFDRHRLEIEDKVFGGQLDWADVYAWHNGTRFLLIYRAPQFYYYIVKERVDSETLSALVTNLADSPAKQI